MGILLASAGSCSSLASVSSEYSDTRTSPKMTAFTQTLSGVCNAAPHTQPMRAAYSMPLLSSDPGKACAATLTKEAVGYLFEGASTNARRLLASLADSRTKPEEIRLAQAALGWIEDFAIDQWAVRSFIKSKRTGGLPGQAKALDAAQRLLDESRRKLLDLMKVLNPLGDGSRNVRVEKLPFSYSLTASNSNYFSKCQAISQSTANGIQAALRAVAGPGVEQVPVRDLVAHVLEGEVFFYSGTTLRAQLGVGELSPEQSRDIGKYHRQVPLKALFAMVRTSPLEEQGHQMAVEDLFGLGSLFRTAMQAPSWVELRDVDDFAPVRDEIDGRPRGSVSDGRVPSAPAPTSTGLPNITNIIKIYLGDVVKELAEQGVASKWAEVSKGLPLPVGSVKAPLASRAQACAFTQTDQPEVSTRSSNARVTELDSGPVQTLNVLGFQRYRTLGGFGARERYEPDNSDEFGGVGSGFESSRSGRDDPQFDWSAVNTLDWQVLNDPLRGSYLAELCIAAQDESQEPVPAGFQSMGARPSLNVNVARGVPAHDQSSHVVQKGESLSVTAKRKSNGERSPFEQARHNVEWRQGGGGYVKVDVEVEKTAADLLKEVLEDARKGSVQLRTTEGSSQVSGNFAVVAEDGVRADKAGNTFNFKPSLSVITTGGASGPRSGNYVDSAVKKQ